MCRQDSWRRGGFDLDDLTRRVSPGRNCCFFPALSRGGQDCPPPYDFRNSCHVSRGRLQRRSPCLRGQ